MFDKRITVAATDPDAAVYLVQPGQGLDGVASVLKHGYAHGCGVLLDSGRHLLTAAHLADQGERAADLTVTFQTATGVVTVQVAAIHRHPAYRSDDPDINHDIAVFTLATALPASVDRYPLYRASDEIGQPFQLAGWGVPGTGHSGEDPHDPSVVLRTGANTFDALGETFNDLINAAISPGTQLVFDFDDGSAGHDASGRVLGLSDPGLGAWEVNTAAGDSGGPAFLDGRVAGITSYGFSPASNGLGQGIDVDGRTNSSYGEFSVETRVSAYQSFIDGLVGRGNRATRDLVDPDYYLQTYPDVAQAVAAGRLGSAHDHFIAFGAWEGRNPDAFFDAAYYLAQQPDVAQAVAQGEVPNAYWHYTHLGWQEGRDPSASFDLSLYLAANPDVAAARLDPLSHFLTWGYFEGREWFSVA